MADGLYRGRFAPSPTGPLHFGSLVAAVGSWLDARAHGGEWLVRIEDIDEPRNVAGADEAILRTLASYGLNWDGPVTWQTRRHTLYRDAIDSLGSKVFPCSCTRREAPGRYPGTCRNGPAPGREGRAIRLRVTSEPIAFVDRRLGAAAENLEETCGDFVLRRADGLYAYQLAVVVDDAAQEVTAVVRGEDLWDSTARQIFLQRQLGVATPSYLHLPIAKNQMGEKLSKQTLAPAVPNGDAETLRRVLRFLEIDADGDTCEELLRIALPKWFEINGC